MRHVWLLALLPALACTDGTVESGARLPPVGSSPAAGQRASESGKELVPAEWTVFEDTSETGEVVTASLQLPAANDITGLLDEEAPRLVLRCVAGKVEASIDIEPADTAEPVPDSNEVQPRTVKIELDSAPACE